MSEEVAQAAGDIAYWQRRALTAEAHQAAIVEACDAFGDFALSYAPDSALAVTQPTFYSLLRVYGKNAHAAVAATKTQADAFLAELAELKKANREVALLNADYLTALDAAYRALLSYAHGNSAPFLAEEIAAFVLKTIEKASRG